MSGDRGERLFVYGALLDRDLQLDTFGRVPDSAPALLPGYASHLTGIPDARFSDRESPTVQNVVRRTDDPRDKVVGEVLALDLFELEAADEVQLSTFRRTRVALADGEKAWVYL
ncbi:gamma-glutamylcyclotransferase family protein [Microbacterium sp.]|uniref:gamma-glutamylcyclotransferase family protein n=1 Tax=Microbacterium sp. TaxID=51671 RepID=UPI003736B70A